MPDLRDTSQVRHSQTQVQQGQIAVDWHSRSQGRRSVPANRAGVRPAQSSIQKSVFSEVCKRLGSWTGMKNPFRRSSTTTAVQSAPATTSSAVAGTRSQGAASAKASLNFSRLAEEMGVQIAVLDDTNTLTYYGTRFAAAGADTINLTQTGDLLEPSALRGLTENGTSEPRIFAELPAGNVGVFEAVDAHLQVQAGVAQNAFAAGARNQMMDFLMQGHSFATLNLEIDEIGKASKALVDDRPKPADTIVDQVSALFGLRIEVDVEGERVFRFGSDHGPEPLRLKSENGRLFRLISDPKDR